MISPRSYVRVLKIIQDKIYSPFGVMGAPHEAVDFERTDWFFPNCTVQGLAHVYVPGRCKELDGVDSERGVIVVGYRCPECRKVFFCGEFDQFIHEYQQAHLT